MSIIKARRQWNKYLLSAEGNCQLRAEIPISWRIFELRPSVAIMNNVPMNIHIDGSVWTWVFNSLDYIPRNDIAGSYGTSMFNFLSLGRLSRCRVSPHPHLPSTACTSCSYQTPCSCSANTSWALPFLLLQSPWRSRSHSNVHQLKSCRSVHGSS